MATSTADLKALEDYLALLRLDQPHKLEHLAKLSLSNLRALEERQAMKFQKLLGELADKEHAIQVRNVDVNIMCTTWRTRHYFQSTKSLYRRMPYFHLDQKQGANLIRDLMCLWM